ncbi:hypothetical protein JQM83_09175 [Parabacteroides distasonis]|nr:hypothetical protein [Parabacteroides distasonis]
MNKHTYTFLTLFLLISSLFGNPVRGEVTNTYFKELTPTGDNPILFTDQTIKSQYFLIGTPGSDSKYYFLKAGESGSAFTVLASDAGVNPSDQGLATSNWATDVSAYLWKIEPHKITGSANPTYRLKNQKTGTYLKLNESKDLPKKDDNATIEVFDWFTDYKYSDSGCVLTFGSYALTIDNGVPKIVDKADNNPKLYVYAIKPQPYTAEQLNSHQGNGFELAALSDGQKMTVLDNPLLDKKLVAITFTVASEISLNKTTDSAPSPAEELAALKIVAGTEAETATPGSSRTYFIASGASNLLQYVDKSGKFTISFNAQDKNNLANVVKAFKETVFVAVNKDLKFTNQMSPGTTVGLGYDYAIFTGRSLLEATDRDVPIENAMFDVKSSGVENLLITNLYAKFPKDGVLSEQAKDEGGNLVGIRPFILTNNMNAVSVITAPFNGEGYVWTMIGFSPSSGSISSDDFKDKSVQLTIADQEVRKSSTGNPVATDIFMNGWRILPNCSTQLTRNGDNAITGYANNVTFTQPTAIAGDKPEGVWTLTKTDGYFFLANRESGNQICLGQIIYQVGENLYQLQKPLEGDCQGVSVQIDSLMLKEVALGELDGYAHSQAEGDLFDKQVLASTPYKLGVQNATFDGTLLYATAINGEMTVTSKQEEGLSLLLTPCDTVFYGYSTKDKDGKDVYTLRRVRYALQDQNTGRFIKYDLAQSMCVLDAGSYINASEALSTATKFYLKEKDASQYELILSQGYYDATNNNQWVETGGNLKVYTNTRANLSSIQLYMQMSGDKFGLYTKQDTEVKDDILSKLLGKSDTTLVRLNFLSTMNGSGSQPWMLAVDADRFLVEGQPISKPNIDIGTKAQGGLEYEAVHFSLILDTAYVQRAGVTTPLYYIAMPSDKSSEQIQQVGKKTVGYYLFAMTDSIYNGADKNTREDRYCYHFWSQHNPRLRFVQATHEGDTIYIETANPSAKDTIQAGSTEGVALATRQRAWLAAQSEGTAGNPQNNTNKGINYGLFAFEANPKATEGSLEYALWNPASSRYVTYLNGNVVLTQEPTYYKLDVSRPGEGHFVVANEPVVAEPEPFAVVGGIGQVEICQAAGKQVHIYNILGKELANRRLTSDREQIALPKGLAIVTVEGETAVKVIVK